MLAWLSVGMSCRFSYGPADATATHCLLIQQIQTGFTFLVLAHPGSPRQSPGGRKTVVVSVVVWLTHIKTKFTKATIIKHCALHFKVLYPMEYLTYIIDSGKCCGINTTTSATTQYQYSIHTCTLNTSCQALAIKGAGTGQRNKWNNGPSLKNITHTHTTVLWLSGFCPGQPGWTSTRRSMAVDQKRHRANWIIFLVKDSSLWFLQCIHIVRGKTGSISVLQKMSLIIKGSLPLMTQQQQQQPFYGSVDFVWDNLGEPVPEETSPTHTHCGHQSSQSAFSIYYDPWHPPYSIQVLYSLFPQSPSFLWSTSWPGTLCFIPNHYLLFATHAHTIATCFAVVPRLCHLNLVSLSILYSQLYLVTSHHTSILPFSSLPSFSFLTGQVVTSVQHTALHTTAVQSPSHCQWYILIGKQRYQLPEFIPSN